MAARLSQATTFVAVDDNKERLALTRVGGGGTTPDFHLSRMRLQAEKRFSLRQLLK